jgi:hypothetical protein
MTLNQLITNYTTRRTEQRQAEAIAAEHRRTALRNQTAATFWRILPDEIADIIPHTDRALEFRADDHVAINAAIDITGTPANIRITLGSATSNPWLKIELAHPDLGCAKEHIVYRAEQIQINDDILDFFANYTASVAATAKRQTQQTLAYHNRRHAAALIKETATNWHNMENAYQSLCAEYAQTIMDQNWTPWYAWTVRYVPDSLNIVRQLDDESDLVCTVLAQPTSSPLTFRHRISEHNIVAPGGTIKRMVVGAILDATLTEFTAQPDIQGRSNYHHHIKVGNYHINLPPTLAHETIQAIQFDDSPARQHPDWRDYVHQHLPAFADFLTDWRYYCDEITDTAEIVNRTPEEIESMWSQQIQDRLPED